MLLNKFKHHHTKTLLTFTICLGLGLFMSCLRDIFFILIIIFTMINQCFYNDYNLWCFSTFLGLKVCEECNNFHYWRSIFMVNNLKFSKKCFWDSWILKYCQFSCYLTFITKEKLHFSVTCSFYCCLEKELSALKVAFQFAIRGLVVYKPVTYNKKGISIN